MRIALATCARVAAAEPAGLEPDDEFLRQALGARGAAVDAPVWNDPGVDWSAYDLVAARSTWDYHLDREAFVAWMERLERVSRVVPGPVLARWNSHKTYLGHLAGRGAPVTPTVFLEKGQGVDLPALLAGRGWARAVIKPTIGLDSYGIAMAEADDPGPAQAHLDGLLAEREVMVQPYLESVAGHGERSVVMIGGELSHAVRKRSFFLGGRHAGPEGVPVPIEADEAEAARAVLAAARAELRDRGVERDPCYGRVDLARDGSGRPVLMELELVEPTLFFGAGRGSAGRLAGILLDLAREGR